MCPKSSESLILTLLPLTSPCANMGRVLDRKVRNIDLGVRTDTFKYPPHLAQEGRSEGLWGIKDGSNIDNDLYVIDHTTCI